MLALCDVTKGCQNTMKWQSSDRHLDGKVPARLQFDLDAQTRQLHRLHRCKQRAKHPPQTEVSCELRSLVQDDVEQLLLLPSVECWKKGQMWV